MVYIGEIISLGVAFSFTVAALSCEVAGRQWGGLVLNVWRMLLGCALSCILTWVLAGYPFPVYARVDTWMWLALSGFVGYFFGDWCLLNSYLTIGSRYGQLLVTLSPMYAAVSAWLLMDEKQGWQSLVAMTVTIGGIAVSVLGRGEGKRLVLQLPLQGVLYGIGSGVGQGLGLVLGMMGIKTYIAEVPTELLPKIGPLLPFSANAIRCITGLICFTAWLLLKGTAWGCGFLVGCCAVYCGRNCQYTDVNESYYHPASVLLPVSSAPHRQGSYRRYCFCNRRLVVLLIIKV